MPSLRKDVTGGRAVQVVNTFLRDNPPLLILVQKAVLYEQAQRLTGSLAVVELCRRNLLQVCYGKPPPQGPCNEKGYVCRPVLLEPQSSVDALCRHGMRIQAKSVFSQGL